MLVCRFRIKRKWVKHICPVQSFVCEMWKKNSCTEAQKTHYSRALCVGHTVFSVQYSLCVCLAAQSCPAFCDPMDSSSLPVSSVHGILGKILECVATPSSRGSSQPKDRTQVSHIAGSLPSKPPWKPTKIKMKWLLRPPPWGTTSLPHPAFLYLK